MPRAWLSLGANLGDPDRQLRKARDLLAAHAQISVAKQSPIHLTAPWGKTDQAMFHNLTLEIETTLSPLALLDVCQDIENRLGRVRREKWGPRVIDLDIIAYDRVQMHEERLTLPHRHAHERDFVLSPLRDLSPDTADWILSLQQP